MQVVASETGWLTAARDVSAFTEVSCGAAHDVRRRERFGEAGRRRILWHFCVERVVSEYRRVLFEGCEEVYNVI
jgi:hypothetical protein